VPSTEGDYETSIIDGDDAPPRPVGPYAAAAALASVLASGGAPAKASDTARSGYDAPSLGVGLADQEYVLATTSTLTTVGDTFGSWVEATEAAGVAGPDVQVLGCHEVTT
jgi:hypothetical protein